LGVREPTQGEGRRDWIDSVVQSMATIRCSDRADPLLSAFDNLQ
jgi:hypothetical protein